MSLPGLGSQLLPANAAQFAPSSMNDTLWLVVFGGVAAFVHSVTIDKRYVQG